MTGFAFPLLMDIRRLSGHWRGHQWAVILRLPAMIRLSGCGGGWRSTSGYPSLFSQVMKGVYTALAGAEEPMIERKKSGWDGSLPRAVMVRY